MFPALPCPALPPPQALLQAELRSLLSTPKRLMQYINPGRLVRVLPQAFEPQVGKGGSAYHL